MVASLTALRERAGDGSRYRRYLLLVILAGLFSSAFPVTILSISVPDISRGLHSQPSTITWVTTAPSLVGAVLTPLMGRIGDLRGNRRLFIVGIAVSGVFALTTAAAWNAGSLILFRTLSQVGGAAIVPASFAMLFRAFPGRERVRAASLASATLAGATATGIVVGGPMIDLMGWRPIFIVQAVIAVVTVLPALALLPQDRVTGGDRSLDVPGAVSLTAAIFLLTFGINRLGIWGPSILTIGAVLLAPVAAAAFVLIERRAPSPLLPLRVLKASNIRVVCVVSLLIGSIWGGTLVTTPLFLQLALGLTATVTSLALIPRNLMMVTGAVIANRIGGRAGERILVTVSCVALGLVMGLLAIGAALSSTWFMVVALALSGLAMMSGAPALTSSVSHGVDPADYGLAASLQQTANQIGVVLGIGALTAISGNSTTPGPYVVNYLIGVGVCLVAGLISLRIVDARSGRARPEDPAPAGEPVVAIATISDTEIVGPPVAAALEDPAPAGSGCDH